MTNTPNLEFRHFEFSGCKYFQASGQPIPHFSWHRSDGSLIVSGAHYQVEILHDGTTKLTINKCTANDSDTYLCVAENEGGAVQARCSLNVIGSFLSRFPDKCYNSGCFG